MTPTGQTQPEPDEGQRRMVACPSRERHLPHVWASDIPVFYDDRYWCDGIPFTEPPRASQPV
jgi:hypothetical protein